MRGRTPGPGVTVAPMTLDELKAQVSEAWADREKLKERPHAKAVRETIELLDKGALRVAAKGAQGWEVSTWVMQAILLYFAVAEMKVTEVGPFEYYDKLPLKKGLEEAGVRRGASGGGALRRASSSAARW